jgi:hypothetical protein
MLNATYFELNKKKNPKLPCLEIVNPLVAREGSD